MIRCWKCKLLHPPSAFADGQRACRACVERSRVQHHEPDFFACELATVAAELGVSVQRATEIENAALTKVRLGLSSALSRDANDRDLAAFLLEAIR